jgi:hypothetical protein
MAQPEQHVEAGTGAVQLYSSRMHMHRASELCLPVLSAVLTACQSKLVMLVPLWLAGQSAGGQSKKKVKKGTRCCCCVLLLVYIPPAVMVCWRQVYLGGWWSHTPALYSTPLFRNKYLYSCCETVPHSIPETGQAHVISFPERHGDNCNPPVLGIHQARVISFLNARLTAASLASDPQVEWRDAAAGASMLQNGIPSLLLLLLLVRHVSW